MAEVTVTKDNFQKEVMESNIPVLVDFWATWCGPCQMLAPTIEKLADELVGQVKVCKIDVDMEPELSAQFKIVSIPTVMVFKNGEVTGKLIGYQKEENIRALL